MPAVLLPPGFSLTNRLILYTSMMLAPAQFVLGFGSYSPSNLIFLGFNWYNQLQWFWLIKADQLGPFSLVPVHFNTIYVVTYLGGVTSGNIYMGVVLGVGSAGVLVLNCISGWMSWAANQPRGFGTYHFYFFGNRTLNPGWHNFMLTWQITDSTFIFIASIVFIFFGIVWTKMEKESKPWHFRFVWIFLGAAMVSLPAAPLIAWTEMIVTLNCVQSSTDMLSVWLFVAQVVTLLIPSFGICEREDDGGDHSDGGDDGSGSGGPRWFQFGGKVQIPGRTWFSDWRRGPGGRPTEQEDGKATPDGLVDRPHPLQQAARYVHKILVQNQPLYSHDFRLR